MDGMIVITMGCRMVVIPALKTTSLHPWKSLQQDEAMNFAASIGVVVVFSQE
jgi:hypothetical protein